METQEIQQPPKPKKISSQPTPSQHIKVLDCNQPVSRVIFECWHCRQGILSEVDITSSQFLEVPCPNCGKTGIRLMAGKILSTTAIPSPWG